MWIRCRIHLQSLMLMKVSAFKNGENQKPASLRPKQPCLSRSRFLKRWLKPSFYQMTLQLYFTIGNILLLSSTFNVTEHLVVGSFSSTLYFNLLLTYISSCVSKPEFRGFFHDLSSSIQPVYLGYQWLSRICPRWIQQHDYPLTYWHIRSNNASSPPANTVPEQMDHRFTITDFSRVSTTKRDTGSNKEQCDEWGQELPCPVK